MATRAEEMKGENVKAAGERRCSPTLIRLWHADMEARMWPGVSRWRSTGVQTRETNSRPEKQRRRQRWRFPLDDLQQAPKDQCCALASDSKIYSIVQIRRLWSEQKVAAVPEIAPLREWMSCSRAIQQYGYLPIMVWTLVLEWREGLLIKSLDALDDWTIIQRILSLSLYCGTVTLPSAVTCSDHAGLHSENKNSRHLYVLVWFIGFLMLYKK